MPETVKPKHSHEDSSSGTRAGQGWCIPRPVSRFGGKLMEQQLWCWGQDIEFSDGNLLMRYGFERKRDQSSADRSTCYRLDDDELHVCLWGFGMFFGRRDLGGIYISRSDFSPKWAPVESLARKIHWPEQLPVFDRPQGGSQWQRARKLWKEMLLWIASYEKWGLTTVGIEHRRKCVENWLRPLVRAEKIAPAWQFLGRRDWEKQDLPLSQAFNQYTISKEM